MTNCRVTDAPTQEATTHSAPRLNGCVLLRIIGWMSLRAWKAPARESSLSPCVRAGALPSLRQARQEGQLPVKLHLWKPPSHPWRTPVTALGRVLHTRHGAQSLFAQTAGRHGTRRVSRSESWARAGQGSPAREAVRAAWPPGAGAWGVCPARGREWARGLMPVLGPKAQVLEISLLPSPHELNLLDLHSLRSSCGDVSKMGPSAPAQLTCHTPEVVCHLASVFTWLLPAPVWAQVPCSQGHRPFQGRATLTSSP